MRCQSLRGVANCERVCVSSAIDLGCWGKERVELSRIKNDFFRSLMVGLKRKLSHCWGYLGYLTNII